MPMKQYPVYTASLPNGETMAYRMAGHGSRTFVLIHGNMSSSVHWQTTMEALAEDYRVIAPDLRGFGDSSYHATFDSLLALARDVEALLEQLNVEKCILVGWSAGGGVAMEIAADCPEMVEKLILLDSVPTTGYPIFRKDAEGKPILNELLRTKEEIASDPVQVLPVLEALAAGNQERMRAIWNATIYHLRQPPAEDYEHLLAATMQQRNLVDVYYALLTFNVSHHHNGVSEGSGRKDLVKCPVYILQGAKDAIVPPEWAEQMSKDFEGRADYVTFAQAGHSVITDDPALFFRTLRGLVDVGMKR